jgi:hypothetical protein
MCRINDAITTDAFAGGRPARAVLKQCTVFNLCRMRSAKKLKERHPAVHQILGNAQIASISSLRCRNFVERFTPFFC